MENKTETETEVKMYCINDTIITLQKVLAAYQHIWNARTISAFLMTKDVIIKTTVEIILTKLIAVSTQ